MNTTSIALIDDHQLIRDGIANILKNAGYTVSFEGGSGEELVNWLKDNEVDVVLTDINMPGMGGIAAAQWVKENRPDIKVIAMSALDDDINVIRMLRAGARAYVLKSASQAELKQAVQDVCRHGYHFSDMFSGKLIKTLHPEELNEETATGISLTDREVEFISYLCTEMTNKEIADKMFASPRTTEGWRKNLCEKLGVKTRVGIVLYALRNNLVQ